MNPSGRSTCAPLYESGNSGTSSQSVMRLWSQNWVWNSGNDWMSELRYLATESEYPTELTRLKPLLWRAL